MAFFRRRPRVDGVINENAGLGTPREGLAAVVRGILSAPRNPGKIHTTKDLEDLKLAARDIQESEPDILVIAGGDGTLHTSATRILREHERTPDKRSPKWLLIPIGSMNTVATSLKIARRTRSPKEFAQTVRRKLDRNAPFDIAHAYPLRISRWERADADPVIEYGFLLGAAFPVNFMKLYNRADLKKQGPWRAVKLIFSLIVSELLIKLRIRKRRFDIMEPVYAEVTLTDLKGEKSTCPYLEHKALMISSVDQIGFGARGMPDAMREPECFMFRSSRLSFWGLLASAGQLWAGLPMMKTHDRTVPKLRIDFKKPTELQLDGELKPPCIRVDVECGPLLEFITG